MPSPSPSASTEDGSGLAVDRVVHSSETTRALQVPQESLEGAEVTQQEAGLRGAEVKGCVADVGEKLTTAKDLQV